MQQKPILKSILTAVLLIVLYAVTIFAGIFLFGDKKYLIISILLILYTFIPFFINFERKKLQARQIVILALMCALAVAGRMVFYSFAQIKPVAAIVIITGICFGWESGFLVGAMSMFVSNMFMGQGPWTPWQMLAFALMGAFAGVLFKTKKSRPNKWLVALYGFIVAFVFGALVLDTASMLIVNSYININMLLASFATGLPFNLAHGISTAVFLLLLTNPMLDKMQRIKRKYGISFQTE